MRNPVLIVALALALAAPAMAERGDRNKPLTVEADQPGTIDLLKQLVVFNGNVIVTQGTMQIRAERVEVREGPEGYRTAVAIGTGARPATFRQKRDGTDEFIEGVAERIEYDGRADMLRFIGSAAVRRVRGASTADEITGQQITYDNTSEVFRVAGGAGNVSPSNPTGRVRAVLAPREGDDSPEASAPPAAGAPLKPTPGLGERR